MPAGTNGTATHSTATRWIGRWAVGAALGQIVFGGTVRLVLAVLLGAALGGLGVWLVQRRHLPGRTRFGRIRPERTRNARDVSSAPRPVRRAASGGYSPLARPRRPEAPRSRLGVVPASARTAAFTARTTSGGPRR